MTYADCKIDTYTDDWQMPRYGRHYQDGEEWVFLCTEGHAKDFVAGSYKTPMLASLDGAAKACCLGLSLMHPDLVSAGHHIQQNAKWTHLIEDDEADRRNHVKRRLWIAQGRRKWAQHQRGMDRLLNDLGLTE
jgi:hypothetical protein